MIADKNHDENQKVSHDPNQSSDTFNHNINKVAKGTVIVFIGTIIGMLFALIGRTVFARYFSSSEYGIFSLGFIIINIFVIIGTLGFQGGITRQIAYYLGKKQFKKVQSIILWSLIICLISSIIITLLIFLCSDIIAIKIFDMEMLSLPLKIFSISIPFYVLLFILSSIFRGFKRVKERVYFIDIIKNLLFPLLLVPVILLSGSFKLGIIAYFLSIVITSIAFIFYFIKKLPIKFKISMKNIDPSIGKELLIFSLPLMFVTILNRVMSWTDTLMLGYFNTSETVGLYNAAVPLGTFISTALVALLFIYTPVITDLYARKKDKEMKRSYAVLTKWICAVTLPLALIFVLYPSVVIQFLFGKEYILAGIALQILVIGFFINNILGPNGATLIALAKTNFLMVVTFGAACINVVLNVILIPKYGINGAAIATVTALITINILRCIKLYSISRIHSLNKNILLPIFLSSALSIVIYFILKEILLVTLWMLPFLFILFVLIYCVSLILTKSIDKEDIDMLSNIEKKTGIKLTKIKQLLKRFV